MIVLSWNDVMMNEILLSCYSNLSSSPITAILFPVLLILLSLILISNTTDDFLSPEEFANYGRADMEQKEEYLTKEHLEAIALRKWKFILSWIAFHPNQVATLNDKKGQTILHHAALFRAPAHIMECILWAAPELAAIPNRDNELALHWAIRLSTPNPVLNLLLEANPEAAFSRDRENITPLSLMWERHQTSLINTWRSDRDQLLTESDNTWKRILCIFRAIHVKEEQEKKQKKKSHQGCKTAVTFQPLHTAVSRPLPPGLLPLMLAVYKDELHRADQNGLLPLMVACQSPIANRYCDVLTKIQQLINAFPDAAKSKASSTGRYPLHEALSSGILWNDGIESLIQSYPPALDVCDPVSGLFPFALAASEKHGIENETKSIVNDASAAVAKQHHLSTLTTVYSLLREDPSVLRLG